MIRQLFQRIQRHAALLAGLGMGLLVSVGAACAVLQWSGAWEKARIRSLETRLHAAASHSSDTLAVATGYIDQGVEGIFVLDFISGYLTCGVLNPRSGQIAGLFRRNVAADLGVVQGKQPKYLMVTGYFDAKGTVSNTRPALSLVYVADSTTGRYVGYMLPWNSQALNANRPQIQNLVPIGGGSARNVAIE
jgi:hypothetical protein